MHPNSIVLTLTGLCIGVVNMPKNEVFGVILPALGVQLLIGNVSYTYLARRLARREGRTDVTALPYGPSVPHTFIVVFVVMLPVFLQNMLRMTAWQTGMVMLPGPLLDAIESRESEGRLHRVLLTPQGQPFTQATARRLAQKPAIALVCGRYEGIDERVCEAMDEHLSLGDFVMTGGEVAAMAVIEATARLLPGGLGNAESVCDESHAQGLLEYPQYTRPPEFRGARVPEVLAVCEDPTVTGAPFYVMSRVHGHVVTSAIPEALGSVDNRRRMAHELVDALVEIHAVDWRAYCFASVICAVVDGLMRLVNFASPRRPYGSALTRVPARSCCRRRWRHCVGPSRA